MQQNTNSATTLHIDNYKIWLCCTSGKICCVKPLFPVCASCQLPKSPVENLNCQVESRLLCNKILIVQRLCILTIIQFGYAAQAAKYAAKSLCPVCACCRTFGTNCNNLPKITIEKFVKLSGHTCVCNTLTSFEFEVHKNLKRKLCKSVENCFEKLVKSHQVKLFLAYFTHLKPQWGSVPGQSISYARAADKMSGGAPLQQPSMCIAQNIHRADSAL